MFAPATYADIGQLKIVPFFSMQEKKAMTKQNVAEISVKIN